MKNKSTSQPAPLCPPARERFRSSPGEGGLRRTVASRESGPDRRSDRRRFGEDGFFDLRVLIGLFLVLTGVLFALIGFGTFLNVAAQPNADADAERVGQMRVIPAMHSDLSRPLREQPVVWPQAQEREPDLKEIPIHHHDAPDPVIQSSLWQPLIKTPAIPAPIHQWAGISKPCNGCSTVPPDTNGAVGKAQYVAMVNDALQVFDKLTGTSLLGPIPIASVWVGFGRACETRGTGDPVVAYDRLADRWVISEFARPVGVDDEQNECIAVSRTGDATGEWYRYDFHLTNLSQDYPKFGVWPDGYYMSANMFGSTGFIGPQPFVFDRAKMLVGDPTATVQTTGLVGGKNEPTFLPSDLDGMLPPPPGEPNHFVAFPKEENVPPEEKPRVGSLARPTPRPTPTATPVNYRVWDFHVDWDHPANSSFDLRASVPAAVFTQLCTRGCVPQLVETLFGKLDGIGDRLMFRNAYRRFPDGRESMLNNFSVFADSVAGIRWFELRRTVPGNWMLRQESTYTQPDGTWRWMGSIASDNQGNIALGFSASSEAIHPQIRYAGRLATDPINTLSGEQHLFDGTGSQEFNRWGDYSDMTVDPVDDCTFYYTNEYFRVTAEEDNWQTRIGYFRFGQCTPPRKGTAHFVVCDRGVPLKTVVSIDGITYGATLADGTYDAVVAPGSHNYAITNPVFGTQTGSFTVANGQTRLVEVCPGGRAAVMDFNGDNHPDYVLRNTSTHQTAIAYLDNNMAIGAALGPPLPPNWALSGVADFNQDSHPDYALFGRGSHQTAMWYLNDNIYINGALGPPLPVGWELVATADFNGDSYPDYMLYDMDTHQTAMWYLNNNVYIGGAYGPTLPANWALIATADFDGDGHPDDLLYNVNTGQTAILYLNNNVVVDAALGPPLPDGWSVVAAADFDGDGYPDYLLYNAGTRQTAIWYLNNNIYVNGAYAPTLFGAWSLIAP